MTIQEIESAMKSIEGEPCGSFLGDCSNQANHLKYWDLGTKLLEAKKESRNKDLPRLNALRASARSKLTHEEVVACDLQNDLLLE